MKKINAKDSKLIKPQRLGHRGLIVTIFLLSMVHAFAIDFYAPALPGMTQYFQCSSDTINLSITLYLLSNALGTLFFGAISDKTGRKTPLLFGSIVYSLASIGCSVSPSALSLILMRCFQAIGASAMSTTAIAILGDSFEEDGRDDAFFYVQTSHIVAPIIAPIIGAFILERYSWHACFYVLALVGVVCLILSMLFQETLYKNERNNDAGIMSQLNNIPKKLKDPRFAVPLLVMAFFAAIFTTYITVASFIYIEEFGLSPQSFANYFSAAAVVSLLGPLLYKKIIGMKIQKNRMVYSLLCAGLLCGLLMMIVARLSVVMFFSLFVIYYLSNVILKPYISSLCMGVESKNAGASASLVTFMPTFIGTIFAQIVSIFFPGYYLSGLAITMIICAATCLILWTLFVRRIK